MNEKLVVAATYICVYNIWRDGQQRYIGKSVLPPSFILGRICKQMGGYLQGHDKRGGRQPAYPNTLLHTEKPKLGGRLIGVLAERTVGKIKAPKYPPKRW